MYDDVTRWETTLIAATIGEMDMMNYGPDEIREERTRYGWTQRAFADMIGVTPVSVSKWESGDTKPSYNHMRRIIEVFRNGGSDDEVTALRSDVTQLRAELDRLAAVVGELAQLVVRSLGVHVEALDLDATPPADDDARDARPDTESGS